MKTRIAINGAAGRMGRRLVALASADPELEVAAALEFAKHTELGKDAGLISGFGEIGVPLTAALDAPVQAVIDFSVPAGAEAITATCVQRKLPLVMATTGLTEKQRAMI